MARYDAIADWYEHEFPVGELALDAAVRLVGAGSGRLIDVACGGGKYDAALTALGWSVIGVDESEAQLAYARGRGVEVVQADAAALPFEDGEFAAAVSIWLHTDADDFRGVVREVRRVLRPHAPFVYVGGHPCFVGPHARFISAEGIPELHPGYNMVGRYGGDVPGAGPDGLRARIGAVHLPLAEFFHAFLDAGFVLEHIEELGIDRYPYMVGTRWR